MNNSISKCNGCGKNRVCSHVSALGNSYCWECLAIMLDNAIDIAESSGLDGIGDFVRDDLKAKEMPIKPSLSWYVKGLDKTRGIK